MATFTSVVYTGQNTRLSNFGREPLKLRTGGSLGSLLTLGREAWAETLAVTHLVERL